MEMLIPNSEIPPRRPTFWRAAGLLLLLATASVFLEGCAVDEVCVISYSSSAEVKPPESRQMAAAGAVGSSLPWDIVLGGISDILTGARKKAIEEKVGYREWRSFTLFRLKAAETPRDHGSEPSDLGPQEPLGKAAK